MIVSIELESSIAYGLTDEKNPAEAGLSDFKRWGKFEGLEQPLGDSAKPRQLRAPFQPASIEPVSFLLGVFFYGMPQGRSRRHCFCFFPAFGWPLAVSICFNSSRSDSAKRLLPSDGQSCDSVDAAESKSKPL